jgi:fucokinase
MYKVNQLVKLWILELKLRQEKALLDKESLIICIEDPEKPIGSGGATLNALLVVAESLSAQKGLKVSFI